MKKLLLSGIVLTSLLTACHKNDDGQSKKDIIQSGQWLLTAQKSVISVNGVVISQNDDYADLDECSKDDLTSFRNDGHLIYDNGAVKCDLLDPQTMDLGTWKLTDNDTKLALVFDGESSVGSIEQLDNNTFKIRAENSGNVSGVVVDTVVTSTFLHK